MVNSLIIICWKEWSPRPVPKTSPLDRSSRPVLFRYLVESTNMREEVATLRVSGYKLNAMKWERRVGFCNYLFFTLRSHTLFHFQSCCFHFSCQNGPNSKVVKSDFCRPILGRWCSFIRDSRCAPKPCLHWTSWGQTYLDDGYFSKVSNTLYV